MMMFQPDSVNCERCLLPFEGFRILHKHQMQKVTAVKYVVFAT